MYVPSVIFAETAAAPAAAAPANTTAIQQQPSAAPAAKQPGFMESLGGFLPMIVIIVVMFYLMYRSQKKEQKRKEEMLNSIRKGSEVVTLGGLMGTIDEIKEDRYVIALADNVKVQIAKSAVAHVKKADEPAKTEADKK